MKAKGGNSRVQKIKLFRIRRLAVLFMAGALLFAFLPVRASALAEPEELSSKACILYNPENDTVLYAKNADSIIYPASTVKIMTGILAYEHYAGNLDTKITVTKEALRGLSGNYMGLEAGETLTARDLLYGMLLTGANDAALVLAYDAGGSVAAFVTQMNAKAKELGAENTFYTNPTGLHDNSMVTTASDLSKIAAYAAQNKDFLEMTSALQYTIPASGDREERVIYNRNHLLTTRTYTKYYYSLAKGMSAGSTTQAGNCLVTTARKDGITYICVVMGAPYDEENNYVYSYSDAKKLFQWAFENYSYRKIVDTTTMIYELPGDAVRQCGLCHTAAGKAGGAVSPKRCGYRIRGHAAVENPFGECRSAGRRGRYCGYSAGQTQWRAGIDGESRDEGWRQSQHLPVYTFRFGRHRDKRLVSSRRLYPLRRNGMVYRYKSETPRTQTGCPCIPEPAAYL